MGNTRRPLRQDLYDTRRIISKSGKIVLYEIPKQDSDLWHTGVVMHDYPEKELGVP